MKKLLKKILNKLGYTIHKVNQKKSTTNRINKDYLLFNFYDILKQMSFYPKHIIDVGANHGTWTRAAMRHFPDAYYTLLEPQEWLKPSLQDLLDVNPKVTFNAVGAGEQSGCFLFTIVGRDDSCSFRYTEAQAKAGGYKQVEIPIITLNEIVSKNSSLPFPDLVKIDAEGLDIEVLKGASALFGKTEVFMVEAGVVNKVFDNSFFNIISFMDENGYRLFDITDLNRPFQPKVLWLVELAFIKKGGIIDSFKIDFDL
ncbi:FkbM family methyltransferase [Flavobacterium maritimum]|uniref:FkbM family methyltransferase n=1 Tax=Flavobacterium maritimum TaxID=3149042 RepID=UPI0032B5F63B